QLLAFSTQPKKIGYRRNEIKNEEQAKLQHFYSFVFYVGDQFRLKDWNIDMNVRMSVYDNRNRKIVCIEPRIKTEYAIDSYNTTWIGIGVNNQPLFSLKKYYLGGLPIDSWVPFKNSQIQKSVQYFAGWKNTYLNRFTFSVDAYYKKMSDLVLIFDSEEYLNNFGGYNSASGYSYGGELMVEYLGKYVNILASYTYSRSTRKIEEKRFNYPFDTPHDLNLFGKIATVNKKESKQYFSFNLNYHTGLPYMLANGVYSKLEGDGNLYPFYPESEIMDNPQYPNTRLTDYFRLDIGYNIEKKKRKGSSVWQFSLINLTNTHNPYMIYRHKDKYKSIAIFPFMPSISFKRNF
ncbi:hypothetical protein LJB85_04120, partial [Porphyromonadaceae bacterium OttesenSCG-928-L07]|nr:hypothetical protein [Porphyromonadaceae bacterium OttesenSCG-928-L07]